MGETSFQVDIAANAAGVLTAADSLDRLDVALERATAAAKTAADALKSGEASYNDAENAADKAAKAVERIGVAVEAQRGKLAKAIDMGDAASVERATTKLEAMLAAQAKAAAAADAAKGALDAEAKALEQLQSAATQASDEEKRLGTAIEQANAAAGTGKASEAAEALGKVGGPIGDAGRKIFGLADAWKKMQSTFGDKAPFVAAAAGVALVAAAVVAAGAAIVAGVVKLGMWALAAADAARSQSLLAAGITGSTDAGKELSDSIDRISSRIPVSTDELMNMSKQLAASGLKGKALETALEKTAEQAARLKFGPDFEKAMLSGSMQADRLQKNLAGIFKGLKIDPLLEKLSTVVALFDKNTAAGHALEVLFESLFQPLIDGAADAIPSLVSAFIALEIRVMRTMLALKIATQEYGPELRTIGDIASEAFSIFGTVVAGAAGVIWDFGVGVVRGVQAVMSLGQAAYDAGAAIVSGIAYGIGFAEAKIASFTTIGAQMVEGIASGIANGATKVIDAISRVSDGAVDAARAVLKINSPSKVFHNVIGLGIGEGIAGGIDEGATEIASSVEAATSPTNVSPPSASASKPSRGEGARGSGPDFSGATLNFTLNGVAGADDAEGRIRNIVLQMFEGDLDSLGEGSPA